MTTRPWLLLLLFFIATSVTVWSTLFQKCESDGRALAAAMQATHCNNEQPILTYDQIQAAGLNPINADKVEGGNGATFRISAFGPGVNGYGMEFDFRRGVILIDSIYRLPPLPYVSQVVASLWAYVATENGLQGSMQGLREIRYKFVTDTRTVDVLEEIVEVLKLEKVNGQVAFEAGIGVGLGDEVFYALLGTPIGGSYAHSLAQHRRIYGNKQIARISFSGELGFGAMTLNVVPV